MIKIELDGTEFEFRGYDEAIEFLMACRHRHENPVEEHIHDFSYSVVNDTGFCICGEENND